MAETQALKLAVAHRFQMERADELGQQVESLRAERDALKADKERLDWLESLIDRDKQAANGGFVVQTLEIRNNASLRQALDAARAAQEGK